MRRKQRITLPLFLLSGICLSGCALPFSQPKDAVSLIEKCNKNAVKSCNANVEIGIDMSVAAQGMSLDMPMDLKLDFSVCEESGHGTGNVNMNLFGQSVNSDMEFYMDEGCMYIKQDGADWIVSDNGQESAVEFLSLDSELFKDADFKHNKKHSSYEIIMPCEKLLSDDSFADAFKNNINFDNMGALGISTEDILSNLAGADVIYTFDDKYNMTGIELKEFTYKTSTDIKGTDTDVEIAMSAKLELSDHNNVKEDSVKIPDDVKNSAVQKNETESSADTFAMDNADDTIISPDDTAEQQAEEENEDFTADMEQALDDTLFEEELFEEDIFSDEESTDAVEENTADAGDEESVQNISGDMFGSYNGVNFAEQNNDWSILAEDGWVLDTGDDGEYSFFRCENEKYGEDIVFYVDGTSAEEILNNGFCGYEMDVSFCEDNIYPDMTWNGITFGASADAVIAAYGTPHNVYEGEVYDSYMYELGEDSEITFYVYPDKGLQEVEYSNWNNY